VTASAADAARKPAPSLTLLLAPFTRGLVGAEQPAFMGRLERLAAERYRVWAQQAPAHAETLLACAESEERIAERAERLFPMSAAQAAKLDALLPEVRRVYRTLFVGLSLRQQLALQASAERQGADVWRALMTALGLPHAMREKLEESARLEEESAARLDALLASGLS
jgi:hypothetical protein